MNARTSLANGLTAEEVLRARDYMAATHDALLKAVDNLSASQWNFKPDPDSWSIGENLEHCAILETRVHKIVAVLPTGAEAEQGRNNAEIDNQVLQLVPSRDNKLKAPERVCPTGQWSPEESLRRFQEARAQTIRILDSDTPLRGRVFPHPFLGNWDGYQWLLAAAAHCSRHTAQMLEVKACADFPSREL